MTEMNILITGATSGIGRHAALALARAGHRVFATGRRVAALQRLADEARGTALETLVLDVTDVASVAAVAKEVNLRTEGYGLDALINNAGYGAMGPLEEVSDSALKAQYATNVFGLMAVTRAFVPAMRQRGSGRIVNISSIGGRVPSPLMGAYSSTKYAVECLSDALRIELKPFGVKVVLIEPGSIQSEFNDVAVSTLPDGSRSPYAAAIERAHGMFAQFAKAAVGPEHVTRALFSALFSRSPSARYIRPWRTYMMLWFFRLFPTSWTDAALAAVTGLTRRRLQPKFGAAVRASTALSLALTLIGTAALAENQWLEVSEERGVRIERRAVEGARFEEIRASMRAPVSPAQYFRTVWNVRAFPKFVPNLKRLDVLREAENESVVYQRIVMPLVADRDYTLKLRRTVDEAAQVYQMLFDSDTEEGPAPTAPMVRARDIHGSWTLEPLDGGTATRVTYHMYSDPGGDIPSFIVNWAQRVAPRDLLVAMTARASSQTATP